MHVPQDQWEQLSIEVPRLVDDATVAAVAGVLATNAEHSARNNKDASSYLLRGLVYCDRCGSKMYSTSQMSHGKRVHMYRCRDHTTCALYVQRDRIDAEVWEEAKTLLVSQDDFKARVLAATDSPSTNGNVAALEAMLVRVTKKQGRLVKQLADLDDRTTIQIVRAELKSLGEQRDRLEADLTQLKVQRTQEVDFVTRLDEFVRQAQTRLDGLGMEARQAAMRYIYQGVWVKPAPAQPRWYAKTHIAFTSSLSPSRRSGRRSPGSSS